MLSQSQQIVSSLTYATIRKTQPSRVVIRCHDELWVSWHLCSNSSITLGCVIKKEHIHFVGIFKMSPFWHLPQLWKYVRVWMSLPPSFVLSLNLSIFFTLLSCSAFPLTFLPSPPSPVLSLPFPSRFPSSVSSYCSFLSISFLSSRLCILVFLLQVFIIYPFARSSVSTDE